MAVKEFSQNLLFKNNFACLHHPPGDHRWNWCGLVGRPNVWPPKWQLIDQLIRSAFRWHINTTTPYMLYFTTILAIAKVSKGLKLDQSITKCKRDTVVVKINVTIVDTWLRCSYTAGLCGGGDTIWSLILKHYFTSMGWSSRFVTKKFKL